MTSKNAFNAKSFAEGAGKVAGYLMGRAIVHTEAALDAIEAFARGNANDGQRLSMNAVRAPVQKLEASKTKPFALDAREMAAEAPKGSLKAAFSAGLKAGLDKKPAPTVRRAPTPSFKPT